MTQREDSVRITVALDPTALRLQVRTEVIIEKILEKASERGVQYLLQNAGLLVIARLIRYGNPNIIEANRRINNEEEYGVIARQMREQYEYIMRVAMALNNAGRAFGIILNNALALYAPEQLETQQRDIFGGNQNVEPIFTGQGLVDIFILAAQIDFQITQAGQMRNESAALLLLDNIGGFGGVDNNVVSTILRTAIANKLNVASFSAIFTTLRTENAPVATLPAEVTSAVANLTAIQGNEAARSIGNGAQSQISAPGTGEA